jgi:hypothetical protein
MTVEPRFDFYETVRYINGEPSLIGKLGAVLGRSQDSDGTWAYAIHVYGESHCFCVAESQLESTGQFGKREDFYSGDSIRVSLDGRLIE